ncbi:MAG: formylglycine-generating enzyme family protein [Candidatus Aminicenantes bacterium]
MAINPDQRITDLLLPGFLSFLRRQGFIIGIDHYLRLQELLVKVGPHCPPGDLKYLLCPLFATGEKQQRLFYRAFDSFFQPLQDYKEKEITTRQPTKTDRETREEPVKPKRWQYVLLAALLLILAALLFHRLGEKPGEKSFARTKETAAEVQPRVTDHEQEPGPDQESKETRVKKTWTYHPSFLEKYGYIIHRVGVLVPIIIFLMVEIYQYHRRRLVLVKKRGKKPPYVWPIRVETPGLNLLKNETFYRTARLMRRRLKSDIRVLDIDKTIDASIERAGFPVIRKKVLTRPPEYLMLIDLPAYRDHYAQLFDAITRALEKEGLYVTRYFYEKDPRVCFKEPGQPRVYLTQLQARYSDSRLIICGDGTGLLDPATGNLDSWTGLFRAWQERAILTPLPPKQWRLREIQLAGEFTLLPASIRAPGALVEYFQAPDRTGARVFTQEERHTPFLTPGTENDTDVLREYLGKDTFQWLCACAVWPELHWDLTLYLGALPCMPGNLINEENLMRLLRLSWFRTGTMPEELRWELMTALDKEIHKAIRSALIELLENNPAPEESAAYDDYRLNVAVQHWLLSRLDRKKRRERLKSLKEFNEVHIEQDYTLVRFLESTPGSPLQMVLPKQLRKIFYKKGVPFFGIKTVFRVALTIIAAAAALLFLKPSDFDMPLMVYIPAGEFTMGSNDGGDDEKPAHVVYLDEYRIGKYEVTIKEYMRFVNETKSNYPEWLEEGNEYNINTGSNDYYKRFVYDENCPIVGVSLEDARAYCDWLSNKTGLNIKLPTEAQWEKASRGNDSRKYPWGDREPDETLANFGGKIGKTTPVGSYPDGASPYGLLDMAGNVWEWCSDWYGADYYKNAPQKNPPGPESGTDRVLRGGSWLFIAEGLRCANRNYDSPSYRFYYVGFRLCQDI